MNDPLLTIDNDQQPAAAPTKITTRDTTSCCCLNLPCVGKWFTPHRAVFCLTSVCLLNYLDRGIISGAAVEIKGCALNFNQCDLRPGQNQTGLHDCLYECKACSCPDVKQTGFGINSQQLGYLQSAFMIGYSISSLVYSKLVHTVRPFKIISIALWLWIVAVVLSGASGIWCRSQQEEAQLNHPNDNDTLCSAFYLAIFARALSGVGEAATATIAVVYLDDTLPPSSKGLLFAVYFSAIPVGTAFGFIYAGQIAAHGQWEWAFMSEAPLMIMFAFGSYFVPFVLAKEEALDATDKSKSNKKRLSRPPSLEHISSSLIAHDANVDYYERERGASASASASATTPPRDDVTSDRSFRLDDSLPHTSHATHATPPSTWSELVVCFSSPIYLLTAFGYASYTAVVAGFSFYGPMYIRERKTWGYTESDADLVFGGIVVFSGLVGTGLGGYLLDKGAGKGVQGSARLVPALQQVFVEVTIGALLCIAAGFCNTALAFFGCLAVGVLVMFMTTAGVNVALMWSVPPENRAMAMALSVIIIHLLGDVPSPVVIGAIDRSHAPQFTFLATSSWLAWAVVCWGLAWFLARRQNNELIAMGAEEEEEMPNRPPSLGVLGRLDTIEGSPLGYSYEHPETDQEDDTEDERSPPWQDWRTRQ